MRRVEAGKKGVRPTRYPIPGDDEEDIPEALKETKGGGWPASFS